jgi:hypothetical protein
MTQQEQEFKALQEQVNAYKAKYGSVGDLSDGYHTYNELYEHRCRLFIELCKRCSEINRDVETIYDIYIVDKSDNDEWFLLVLVDKYARTNNQMSYHLPIEHYNECNYIATSIEKKEWEKMFDGHTSKDVLERLENL